MPNEKSDPTGFKTEQPDIGRTHAAQDGPSTGIHDPANRSASVEVDNTTRAAAASTNSDAKKNKEQTSAEESDSDGNLELPEGK
jgi:hypothetical protein